MTPRKDVEWSPPPTYRHNWKIWVLFPQLIKSTAKGWQTRKLGQIDFFFFIGGKIAEIGISQIRSYFVKFKPKNGLKFPFFQVWINFFYPTWTKFSISKSYLRHNTFSSIYKECRSKRERITISKYTECYRITYANNAHLSKLTINLWTFFGGGGPEEKHSIIATVQDLLKKVINWSNEWCKIAPIIRNWKQSRSPKLHFSMRAYPVNQVNFKLMLNCFGIRRLIDFPLALEMSEFCAFKKNNKFISRTCNWPLERLTWSVNTCWLIS